MAKMRISEQETYLKELIKYEDRIKIPVPEKENLKLLKALKK